MQETTVRPPREAHGAESGITYKHMCELKPVYGQQLIPLYERLSRPDLLNLCKDLHTTNANESPKHLPTSPQILEIGVAMSVLEFNYGSRGIGLIFLRKFVISTGYYFDKFISMSTKKRRLCSICHSSQATKKMRIGKKLFAAVMVSMCFLNCSTTILAQISHRKQHFTYIFQ